MSLRKFLGLCEHSYYLVRSGTVEETFMGGYIGTIHWSVVACAKCGKMKKSKVRI